MRAVIGWLIAGCVVALALFGVYVGMLAFDARDALQASASDLKTVQSSLASSDASHALASAKDAADSVSVATHRARGDTNNPLWRTAEIVPWVGTNLTVVREASRIASDASDNAVTPLASLAGHLSAADFTPQQGHVDTAALRSAADTLSSASTALQRASGDAETIDAGATIGPVRDAVTTLRDQLSTAAGTADATQRAAQLLPAMLGADGPRDYLLLFQNNAELRSSGGIPGALAVVHADHGAITLTRQASSSNFPGKADATSMLPKSTVALYGELPGQFIQDVTLPPQFALSGSLASTLWLQNTGQHVDGVISVDPVALGYLLKATGPVTLPTGETLTSDNAVKVLLSDSYARYPVAQQDEFFAQAATSVFQAVAGGHAKAGLMLPALARAGGEGRILMWSAHADEQKRLAQTTLAGGLPGASDDTARFGVYLNDATGSKMDYYLHAKVATGRALCRADGKANLAVAVTLTNTAPKDAASSLPAYVTGGGIFGVAPGDISTQIAAYGPARSAWLDTTVGGEDVTAKAGIDDGRSVSRYTMQLAPGESKTVRFDFLADAQASQVTASGVVRERRIASVETSASTGIRGGTMSLDSAMLLGVDAVAAGSTEDSDRQRVSAFVTPMTQEVPLSTLSLSCNGP